VARKEDIRDARRVYWESVKKAEAAQKALRRAEKMADEKGLLDVVEQQGYLIGLGDSIDTMTASIKELRDTVDLINASEEYTRGEKRLMIRDLEKMEKDLYEAGIEMFRQVKQSR